MIKLAILIWIMLGTTLAGIGVIVVVTLPNLFDAGMTLIPVVALLGFALAVPGAWVIAKRIGGATA